MATRPEHEVLGVRAVDLSAVEHNRFWVAQEWRFVLEIRTPHLPPKCSKRLSASRRPVSPLPQRRGWQNLTPPFASRLLKVQIGRLFGDLADHRVPFNLIAVLTSVSNTAGRAVMYGIILRLVTSRFSDLPR